jgi:wyosine [tRNA(Phe)-imidazoG37] synthetase (radical SAM superfamily)
MIKLKHIYGPVASWRLGRSVGIDITSSKKICSFDCVYCQAGITTDLSLKRKVFVQTKDVISEFESLPKLDYDYITFSGRGEPTLAKNLGHVIDEIKKRDSHPIAVLTNSTLLYLPDVLEDLKNADLVVAKLDAPNEVLFKDINQPPEELPFSKVIDGIKEYARVYPQKLALQIMFTEENKEAAQELATLAKEINPIEIEINTPTRPSSLHIKPLSKKEISEIKIFFKPLNVYSLYDVKRPKVKVLDEEEVIKRRARSD